MFYFVFSVFLNNNVTSKMVCIVSIALCIACGGNNKPLPTIATTEEKEKIIHRICNNWLHTGRAQNPNKLIEDYIFMLRYFPRNPMTTHLLYNVIEDSVGFGYGGTFAGEKWVDELAPKLKSRDLSERSSAKLILARLYALKYTCTDGNEKSARKAESLIKEVLEDQASRQLHFPCLLIRSRISKAISLDVPSYRAELYSLAENDSHLRFEADYVIATVGIANEYSSTPPWVRLHQDIFDSALRQPIAESRLEDDPWPLMAAVKVSPYIQPENYIRLISVLNDKNDPPFLGRGARAYVYYQVGSYYYDMKQYQKAIDALTMGKTFAAPEKHYRYSSLINMSKKKNELETRLKSQKKFKAEFGSHDSR